MARRKMEAFSKLNFNLKEIEPITTSQIDVFESEKHLLLHGCAGTGKTYISLYLGLDDIRNSLYKKIIIVRSAVPSREIGFLPGTEAEKSRIYEQPYIAICKDLFERGDDPYGQLKSKDVITFMTTSYLRGITFEDSVVIVDECQNMTFHELDSIITRIGYNCRIIFCGDFFQSDLRNNGLDKFMTILKNMHEFDFIEFGIQDIVRSDLVKNYLVTKYKEGL